MKSILLGFLLLATTFTLQAQFSTTISTQDATCWNSTDGSYSVSNIRACFSPINVLIDSTTFTFEQLSNSGYTFINHGAGTGVDRSYSVWAGETTSGPVYIATGTFTDSITFDSTTLYSNSLLDMFVACFDATTSELIWAHKGSTPGNNYTAGYALTGVDDKVFVTGYFTGSATIANFPITSTGAYQAFVAKIDIPTGTVDTIIQIGGNGTEEGYNISYAAGRIYLTGDFSGTASFAGNNYTSAGNQDAFLICLDTSLNQSYWATTGGGTNFDVFTDVVAYDNGGTVEMVYVTGQFSGNATFGTQTVTSSGGDDFYVAGIDTNGTFVWVTQGGSTGNDYCTTIDVNSTGDKLYVGGSWVGSMIFGGQLYTANIADDGFIGYLDTAGILDTVYVLSGTGPDFVLDLQSASDDHLVFSGSFGGTLNYADSNFVSNGNRDAFIGKIGPGFLEIWGKNLGGTGNDVFGSIRIGSDDRLHAAGNFQGNCSAYQSGLISGGADDVMITNDVFSGLIDTTFSVTGLSSGSYTYQMSDSAGNIWIDTVVIGAPDSILISSVIANATSGTANNGAIDLTVTGGAPGYTFIWSNGATTEDISNLVTGQYCVTVTDTTGCSDTACYFVDSVSNAAPFAVMSMVTNLSCFGDSSGAINLTVSGGTIPYSYTWSNGANTQSINGISAGTYFVTVNDNDTSSYIDSFIVAQPDEIVITGNITPPTSGTSNDGEIDASVIGGVPPFTYLWSNAATTQDIGSLPIGTYTLVVTDSTGCVATASFFVDTIANLSLVSIASAKTCINSNNGAIDLTVIGGVPNFSFIWSNGETTEDISGLAPGVYSVTVTDAAGQISILEDSVGNEPIFPDPIVGPINGLTSVQSFVSYNYSVPSTNGSLFDWSASGGNINSTASNAASVLWLAGPSGTLYVTETDINGCFASDSISVTILFVGVNEYSADKVVLYPNPTSDILNIKLPESMTSPMLQVMDIQGRTVFSSQIYGPNSNVSIGFLQTGSYVLSLSQGDQVSHHTVIIQ